MRKVLFRKWSINTRQWEKEFEHEGLFHSWGLDSGDAESWSVALIEVPDGTIEMVLPINIKFI